MLLSVFLGGSVNSRRLPGSGEARLVSLRQDGLFSNQSKMLLPSALDAHKRAEVSSESDS